MNVCALRFRLPAVLLVAAVSGIAANERQFEGDVLPILERSCVQCHGAASQTANLDLRSVDSIRRGGTGKEPVLVPGSASTSLLYRKVADRSMPFGPKKLSDAEIEVIREWIDAGAKTQGSQVATTAPRGGAGHWAFQPVQRPPLPAVRQTSWVRTPVDTFVLSKLERAGIRPPAAADRTTLARRLSLDLTGLPPTPEDRADFETDRAPGAEQRFLERLLARPQYGERWARHWLDVVRFAESNGYERDGAKPQAWRYRDYVIRAFNRDLPFDRFLAEQLAGDELPGSNAEMQIATTFLRLGTWDDEPAEPLLDRYDQLDDILGTTSAAFLGVTLRCARCHDHKFEPFSQSDYYRFLAVFEPLKRPQDERRDLDRFVGTEPELARYRELTAKADAEAAARQRDLDGLRRTLTQRILEKPAGTAELSWKDHLATVLAVSKPAERRNDKEKALAAKYETRLNAEMRAAATAEENERYGRLEAEIREIQRARPAEPARGYVWYEDSPDAPKTNVLIRGDVTQRGESVGPGVPRVFGFQPTGAPAPTAKSTGRRLWLARWMTARENPLVARVIVNRLWQWHFGEGMVASENDFGVMGQRPAQPELLDFLASELMESGWSLKHVQRLIAGSSTFQASSAWDRAAAALDPENTLYWRFKPRRLDAEVVRDSTLAVSGALSNEMFGPSVFPRLPQAVLDGQSKPGDGWPARDPSDETRRSVYIFSKRSLAVPELDMLDAPDTTSSCEQRSVSITGPQALTFLNGDFNAAQAKRLAARVRGEAGREIVEQVRHLYRLVLARDITPGEAAAVEDFMARPRPSDGLDKLGSLCLVLLNSNEFVFLN